MNLIHHDQLTVEKFPPSRWQGLWIDDIVHDIPAIVAPRPDDAMDVMKTVDSKDLSNVCFIYSARGFFVLRAPLIEGTFLRVTVNLQTLQCLAAEPVPPFMHARIIFSESLPIMVLFSRIRVYKHYDAEERFFGRLQPDERFDPDNVDSCMAELKLTGTGLMLLQLHPMERGQTLACNRSKYPAQDNTVDPSPWFKEICETLLSSKVPLGDEEFHSQFFCKFGKVESVHTIQAK